MSVPAGSYLVMAKTVVTGGAANVVCELSGGSESDHAYGETSGTDTQLTLTNIETTVLSAPGKIELSCLGAADHFWYAKLTATQVGAIH